MAAWRVRLHPIGIGLQSRSPQGEGWFETALKKRVLTMRFPVWITQRAA
jgi:hypothetical protein